MTILNTTNPATGEIIKTYDCLTMDNALAMIERHRQAQLQWAKTPLSARQTRMKQLAVILRERQDEMARLITLEMGKPITQSLAEIEKCAWLCEYYAEHSGDFLKPEPVKTESSQSYVCFNPLGSILAIMPWNFPFWQVFRCAVPALMAGNGVVLKHAPISIGSGFAIQALFEAAGFLPHLFEHVVLSNETAMAVMACEHIHGISFTGSEAAGQIIAATAGQSLKKTVLELGGNDPYLVLEDASLDVAVDAIVTSRMHNCGQVCIAAKRVIAVGKTYALLIEKIAEQLKGYAFGDPMDAHTRLGPMARSDLRTHLHQQVEQSVDEGAHIHCGGVLPEGKGFYYPPTLLTDVTPDMTAFREELFGPVVVMIHAKTEEEGIAMANDSRFGLAGAVFTSDLEKGKHIAEHLLNVGTCCVNGFVQSDPRLPFGGIKHSGYGRELSHFGIMEFVNIKTVSIR